jgi:hypothetical protein
MTVEKSAPEGRLKRLKLKKETLKDLDVKGKARKLRGGVEVERGTGCFLCTGSIPPPPTDCPFFTCLVKR